MLFPIRVIPHDAFEVISLPERSANGAVKDVDAPGRRGPDSLEQVRVSHVGRHHWAVGRRRARGSGHDTAQNEKNPAGSAIGIWSSLSRRRERRPKSGVPTGDRTPNVPIESQLLCLLSYGRINVSGPSQEAGAHKGRPYKDRGRRRDINWH